jgi:hypothetical protein
MKKLALAGCCLLSLMGLACSGVTSKRDAGSSGAAASGQAGSGGQAGGSGSGGSGGTHDAGSAGSHGQVMDGGAGRDAQLMTDASVADASAGTPAGWRGLVGISALDACAIATDRKAACWPGSPSPNLNDFGVAYRDIVVAGDSSFCGIDVAGATHCFTYSSTFSPPADERYTQLAMTDHSSACGLLADGTVECWGAPSGEVPPSGKFIWIDGGRSVFFGVKTDGSLLYWPNNGMLGTPPSGVFTQVSAGDFVACALRADHSGVCFTLYKPSVVTELPEHYLRLQAALDVYNCGIRTDGTATCWGTGVGNNGLPPAGKYVDMQAFDYGGCGIIAGGSVTCWGGRAQPQAGLVVQTN